MLPVFGRAHDVNDLEKSLDLFLLLEIYSEAFVSFDFGIF